MNFQYNSSQADINVILGGLLQHKKGFHHGTECDCLNYLLVYTDSEVVRMGKILGYKKMTFLMQC